MALQLAKAALSKVRHTLGRRWPGKSSDTPVKARLHQYERAAPAGTARRLVVRQMLGRSNSPARTPLTKPVQSDTPKVSTGPVTSFESRTKMADGMFATSTQWPAAPLRVLLRQWRSACCIFWSLSQDGMPIHFSSGRACTPQRFLPLSDSRSAQFWRQSAFSQVIEGVLIDLNFTGLHPEEATGQPLHMHDRATCAAFELQHHERFRLAGVRARGKRKDE